MRLHRTKVRMKRKQNRVVFYKFAHTRFLVLDDQIMETKRSMWSIKERRNRWNLKVYFQWKFVLDHSSSFPFLNTCTNLVGDAIGSPIVWVPIAVAHWRSIYNHSSRMWLYWSDRTLLRGHWRWKRGLKLLLSISLKRLLSRHRGNKFLVEMVIGISNNVPKFIAHLTVN